MDLPMQQAAIMSTATDPATPVPPRESHNAFLVLVLIVSLVISTIAVFLFWQNQQLRNQLSVVTASPSPSDKQVPPTDPTAGWQTYSNNQVSFKYPLDWTVAIGNTHAVTYPKDTIVLKSQPSSFDISLVTMPYTDNLKNALISFVHNTFGDFQVTFTKDDSQSASGYIMQGSPNNIQLKISLKAIRFNQQILLATTILQEDRIDTFDQILSTFKFTN